MRPEPRRCPCIHASSCGGRHKHPYCALKALGYHYDRDGYLTPPPKKEARREA